KGRAERDEELPIERVGGWAVEREDRERPLPLEAEHGRHGGHLTRSGAPAESRSGVARGGDVALPGGEASRALVGADRRFEQALAPPGSPELIGGRPDAGRETGEIAGAERRRLQDGRPLDREPGIAQAPPASGTDAARVPLSAGVAMTPSPSRSQVIAAPAVMAVPSRQKVRRPARRHRTRG